MLPTALSGFMLPDWVVLVLLLIGGVYALALLAMPFAVFGVKSRLSAMEEQLEDIQEELRVMTLRAAGARIGVIDQVYPEPAKPAASPPPVPNGGETAGRYREGPNFMTAPISPAASAEPPLRESFGRSRPAAPPPPQSAPPQRVRRIEPRLD